MPKLSSELVASLVPENTDYVLWCSETPGFGARVRPSGNVSYVYQGRIGGRAGKTIKRTIGAASKMECRTARRIALQIAAEFADRKQAIKGADNVGGVGILLDALKQIRDGCGSAETVAQDAINNFWSIQV